MEKLKDVFVTKLSEENGSVVYRMSCTEKAATDFAQKEAVREIKKLCEKYNGMIISESSATLTYKVSFPNSIQIKTDKDLFGLYEGKKGTTDASILTRLVVSGSKDVCIEREKELRHQYVKTYGSEYPACVDCWIEPLESKF